MITFDNFVNFAFVFLESFNNMGQFCPSSISVSGMLAHMVKPFFFHTSFVYYVSKDIWLVLIFSANNLCVFNHELFPILSVIAL